MRRTARSFQLAGPEQPQPAFAAERVVDGNHDDRVRRNEHGDDQSRDLAANRIQRPLESGEDWNAYLTRLMREAGVIGEDEEPSDEERRRFDKSRKDK